jgi:hypothetical protein
LYSVFRKILSNALIAMILISMIAQVAMAEVQTTTDEASQAAVQAAETPAEPSDAPNPSDEAEPETIAAEEQQSDEEQPAITAEPEASIEPEGTNEPEPELVEIPDEQVPLAGGPEPSISIRANRDINALHIGDSLVLTSEVTGFSGMEYTIRWQARVDGQWKDLESEHSTKLVIEITGDNADWAYRAAVDTQPLE